MKDKQQMWNRGTDTSNACHACLLLCVCTYVYACVRVRVSPHACVRVRRNILCVIYTHFNKVFADEGDRDSFIPCIDLFVNTNFKKYPCHPAFTTGFTYTIYTIENSAQVDAMVRMECQ